MQKARRNHRLRRIAILRRRLTQKPSSDRLARALQFYTHAQGTDAGTDGKEENRR